MKELSEPHKQFGTYPKKPTQVQPMSDHKFKRIMKKGPPTPVQTAGSDNKFQRMASIHKQQEQSGDFFPKKIHFGGQAKMKYREGGEMYKKKQEREAKMAAKNAKNEGKGMKKKKNLKGNKRDSKEHSGKTKTSAKKVKGDAVKGTSTEYAQLATSDDDEEDVVDVSDMLQKSDDEEEKEEEVPLLNCGLPGRKFEKVVVTSPYLSGNRFNALGEYQDDVVEEEEEDVEPPKKKQRKKEDSDDEEDEEGDDGPEEEEEDDETERLKFREEISKMPIGKVREMKEKLGIKLFNKTYFGTSEVEKKRKETKKSMDSSEKHGQHRPKEISSKRPVSSFRNIYGEHEKGIKKKRWDPRFDSRAGDFKEVCFENNYQFLDEIRGGEMQELRNEYQTARTEGDEKKAARLKNTLQKMETREKTRAEKRRQAETRKELHDDNIERMLRGEAPIFRTKAQVRRIDAEKKYEELKKDNKLDKYMQRKAKKESAKLKKSRPPFEGYGFQ